MKKILGILGSVGIAVSSISSVMAMTPNTKISMNQSFIDVPKSVNVDAGIPSWVEIENFWQLTDVTVESQDEQIAIARIIDDQIAIRGLNSGIVNLVVSAKYAQSANISVTVNNLKIIDVVSTINVDARIPSWIKIENFRELTNVTVQSQDEEIAIARIIGDKIAIRGLKRGTVNLTVSAKYAQSVNILVAVNGAELKDIKVDKTNVIVYTTESEHVQITNFGNLKNPKVKSFNPNVAITSLDSHGTITIFGINNGIANIQLTANDAKGLIIKVVVKDLKDIEIVNTAEVYVNEAISLNVENAVDLIDLDVHSNNENIIVTISANKMSIEIKGVTVGESVITVSAKHAKSVNISVTVMNLKDIKVNKTNVIIYTAESEQVQITNFGDLANIKVESLDSTVAIVSLDNQGIITITGVKGGSVDIKLAANNAHDLTIKATVKDLKDIEIVNTAEVYVNETISLNVENAANLTNLDVHSNNENIIATVSANKMNIEIKGVTTGTSIVTVSADHSRSVTIKVTINLKNIDVVSTANVNLGIIKSFRIKNFQSLTNVTVQSQNDIVAIAGIMGDEVVIKGLSVGTVNLIVSADHALNATITVTVALKTIDVNQNVTVNVGKFAELKINNFADLYNVAVKSNNPQVAMVIILGDEVLIKGIAVGTTEVIVSANHALDVLIKVTVIN